MNEPLCGDLNRRVTFRFVQTKPNSNSGFTNTVSNEFTVWGRVEAVGAQIFWETSQINSTVTHRIFVRAVKGKTYPCDFKNVVWAVCENSRYKVMRVNDLNGEHRFTLLEVCAEGVN